MIERLFVHGALGPGRPNDHVLDAIGGSWQTATVAGTLRHAGWSAELGYPGIDLDEHGKEVEGILFTSKNLPAIGQSSTSLKVRPASVC